MKNFILAFALGNLLGTKRKSGSDLRNVIYVEFSHPCECVLFSQLFFRIGEDYLNREIFISKHLTFSSYMRFLANYPFWTMTLANELGLFLNIAFFF